MGHIPDDENFDEYMDASAEEWSKPEEPPPPPEAPEEQTDRWGSPIAEEAPVSETERWGSEPVPPATTDYETPTEKKGTKWWIIAIIIAVVLCLCVCVVVIGLSLLGINLFQGGFMQF